MASIMLHESTVANLDEGSPEFQDGLESAEAPADQDSEAGSLAALLGWL